MPRQAVLFSVRSCSVPESVLPLLPFRSFTENRGKSWTNSQRHCE
jgi:hypothetical protein